MPMIDCPRCQKHNNATILNFCMYCGYALTQQEKEQAKINGSEFYKRHKANKPVKMAVEPSIKTTRTGQILLF